MIDQEQLNTLIQKLPPSVTVNMELLQKSLSTLETRRQNSDKVVTKQVKMVTQVDPKDAEMFKFFSEATPCWFSGCEELRKEYFTELANLGPNCPACQKGSIIRKYKPKVEELINKHNETNNRP